MNKVGKRYYEFGPFRLDESGRLLFRGEEIVPVTPRVFELLRVLVQRRGEIVDRDELMSVVWRDRHVVEANIHTTVFALRKILDAGPKEQFGLFPPSRLIESPWRCRPSFTARKPGDWAQRHQRAASDSLVRELLAPPPTDKPLPSPRSDKGSRGMTQCSGRTRVTFFRTRALQSEWCSPTRLRTATSQPPSASPL